MSDISNALGGALNAADYDTTDNSSPVPPGEYPVMIEKAEVRDTKSGTGKLLFLQLSITGDQYANRKVFSRMNISNPNPTAQEIGRRELATLAKAIGLVAVQDSAELIDKAVIAKLKVKENDNEVVTYKSIDSGTPAPAAPLSMAHNTPAKQSTAPAQQQQTAPAPTGKKMPWEK